jgi:O-antigen/teichoic acid export membrane protein
MAIRKGLVAGIAGNASAALVAVIVIPIYLRLLGPDGYGLIGFLATLQGWALLADLGLSTTMNRELARFRAGAVEAKSTHNLLRSAELTYATLGLCIGLVIVALSGPMATHWVHSSIYAHAQLANAVALMGLVLASQWMSTLYRGCLLGLEQQVWVGTVTGVAAIVRGAATVTVLVAYESSIEAFLWTQLAVGATESLALRWQLSHRLPASPGKPRFSLASLASVRVFALGVTATMILATLLTQLDKLLVARFVSLDKFGYFMLAVTISSGLTVMIAPVNNLAYPQFSGLVASRNTRQLAGQYHCFSQLLAVGLFPPALLLAFFAESVLHAWTGDPQAAHAAAPILSVWVAGTALNGLMHIPYAAQLAHGWTRLAAAMNIVTAVCSVPLLAFLVPRYGAVAAAWVWVVINVGYVSIGVPLMHRRILSGEQARWYIQDLLGPFAGCVTTALLAFAAHTRVQPDSRLGEAVFLSIALLVLGIGAAAGSSFARALITLSFRQSMSRDRS